MISKPSLASPHYAAAESADTAVLTAASQTIVVPLEAGRIARLPAGTDLSRPLQQGTDLLFQQADGSIVLIPGGAGADLVLFVGDVEIPAQTVAILLGDIEIEVGAGPAGGAHGSFEDPAPGEIGEGFAYSELLEATDEPTARAAANRTNDPAPPSDDTTGKADNVVALVKPLVDEDDPGFASLTIWRDDTSNRIERIGIGDAFDGTAADCIADIDTPSGDVVDLSALLAGPCDADTTDVDPPSGPDAIHDVIDVVILLVAPASQAMFDNLPPAPADTI